MKFKKIAMFIGLFVVMAATLSSCTKSFCTVNDKAQTLYALEEYKEGNTYADGTNVYVNYSYSELTTPDGIKVPARDYKVVR